MFNLKRVWTIIDKEWAEVFKNRMVLFTIIFMPVFFTILPLIMLGVGKGSLSAGGDVSDVPASFLRMCGASATANDCLMIFLVNEVMVLFMMMPLIIPITIAAYSIVGEKTTRSLEPLLATPVTTEELLAGKGLAAALPAIAATWVCFFIFLLLAPVVGASPTVSAYMRGPTWMIAVLIIGPLMSIVAVNFAVFVSSRVNDPRAAEQISAVLIVPVLGLLFGQIAGLILLSPTFMWITAVSLAVLDVVLVMLGARLFQREAILTRWK